MNKQLDMSFVQDELAEVKTNKTALLEPMSLNEYDESNRPIRLTETTTDGTLLRQTCLTYSAVEHPEDYTEKLCNTPGAGEYATNYTYDFNDRLTKAIFGTDKRRKPGRCTIGAAHRHDPTALNFTHYGRVKPG